MTFADGILTGIAAYWISQKLAAFLDAKLERLDRALDELWKEEGGLAPRSTKAGLGDEPVGGPPAPTRKPIPINEQDRNRYTDRSFYRSRIRELERQLVDAREAMDR